MARTIVALETPPPGLPEPYYLALTLVLKGAQIFPQRDRAASAWEAAAVQMRINKAISELLKSATET
jgi:hypothetical protein